MTTTPRTHAGNYIAGEWLPGDACEMLPVTDPATAETLGTVPVSGPADSRPRRRGRPRRLPRLAPHPGA